MKLFERIVHDSDCAKHNMPAMPNGPCDCGARDIIDMIQLAKHTHVAGDGKDIDTCKKCGHDLRHIVHFRNSVWKCQGDNCKGCGAGDLCAF